MHTFIIIGLALMHERTHIHKYVYMRTIKYARSNCKVQAHFLMWLFLFKFCTYARM